MIHVITGGSGSGKSEYAEQLVMSMGIDLRIYLATMMVWDEEGKKRVERHRRMRAEKNFKTVECYTNLADADFGVKDEKPVVLLECMSNLVANEYYRVGSQAADEIIRGINCLQKKCIHLIIVTNEVFSDGAEYSRETREYIELLGKVNQYLGRKADTMTEVVYGIPIKIK
ncbi:MAG: bifunctional adenosylcobinamide kinase/adenosylcobinamide-phosphate guanylyltransferase [Clostridium sp.]